MNKHSFKQLHSFLLLWGSQTVSQLGTAMTDYAVIIWVYSQRGTASSVTLLTVCTFLPTIFFRFLAGSMVDRQNKKRIMLIADLVAACGTLAVFVLHSAEVLQIWHLYVINFLLSLMNAFQEPASFVAVSLLVPILTLVFPYVSSIIYSLGIPCCASPVYGLESSWGDEH